MRSTLSTFFSISFCFIAIAAADLIHETCQKCAERSPILSYDLCVSSLQAIPPSHTASLPELAVISVKLALVNATATLWSIQKLLENEASDPNLMGSLKDCQELYSDAVPTLENSITAFKRLDYRSGNVLITAAMDAATTCEGGFDVSPLTKQNYDFFQLCDIVLVITRLIPSELPFLLSMYSQIL
ncbi:putative invertase inhibitor [Macadamia integrifolia]|uniref:putative invertase inhibitor n=1 Tax=Macadamia integrifolia TaxID=60698 RepID=UPI001C4FC8AF|nr:putative invertase inhibitor [Macadamia integrifolia]